MGIDPRVLCILGKCSTTECISSSKPRPSGICNSVGLQQVFSSLLKMSFHQPLLLVYDRMYPVAPTPFLPKGCTAIQYFYITLWYMGSQFVVKINFHMKVYSVL